MSLKAFHIFFIILSIVLAFGFAVWALMSYRNSDNVLMIAVALLSVIAGIGLIFYAIRFLKKLKHMSFI